MDPAPEEGPFPIKGSTSTSDPHRLKDLLSNEWDPAWDSLGAERSGFRFWLNQFLKWHVVWSALAVMAATSTGLVMAWLTKKTPGATYAIVGTVAYLFFMIMRYVYSLRSTLEEERTRERILKLLLDEVADELFGAQSPRRVTLFEPHHKVGKVLVRTARVGPQDTTRSNCVYPEGVTFTGLAYKCSGELLHHTFDDFVGENPKQKRDAMEEYYRTKLNVPEEVVKKISNYMMHVKTIATYGLRNNSAARKGVVSADYTTQWRPDQISPARVDRAFRRLCAAIDVFSMAKIKPV